MCIYCYFHIYFHENFFFISFCLRHHKKKHTNFLSFPYNAHQVGFVSIKQMKSCMNALDVLNTRTNRVPSVDKLNQNLFHHVVCCLHKRYQNIWSHIFLCICIHLVIFSLSRSQWKFSFPMFHYSLKSFLWKTCMYMTRGLTSAQEHTELLLYAIFKPRGYIQYFMQMKNKNTRLIHCRETCLWEKRMACAMEISAEETNFSRNGNY